MLLLALACADRAAVVAPVCGQVDTRVALHHVIDGIPTDCEIAWYLAQLDERSTCQGPWFEDLFVTRTPDGASLDLTDQALIFEHAAVPEAVIGADGRTYLFFGEGDLEIGRVEATGRGPWFRTHGLPGWGAINAAVSDDGIEFEKLLDFGIDGIVRGMVVDPDVIALPDGTWRMYYVGSPVEELLMPGSWDDGAAHTVYYAESDDLVHWTQIGEAVRGPNADPSVWCADEAVCWMMSTGLDLSTSTDGGVTWSFEQRQDPFGFAPEYLETLEGGVRMVYNSRVAGGALESQLSWDGGVTWVDEGELVAGDTVEALSFAPAREGGFYAYYHFWQYPYTGDWWGRNPCGGM